MNFIDTSPMTGVRVTGDGYLVADVRCVRTGIQTYTGAEVGKPEMATVRVYRPEAEVFSQDSLASFSHIPVTDDHPSVPVTADNWKDLARGETSGEVLRDGQRLRIPLIVKDAATIRKVQDGKRELSAGYTCELVFEDGRTPEGEAYDAIQKNIRANHMAIVAQGRAGKECRIGDGAVSWGIAPITLADMKGPAMSDNLRTVMVDGLSVSTTDAGAQAIAKLTEDRNVAQAALITAEKEHASAITAKDSEAGVAAANHKTEIEAKDGEIAALKKQIEDSVVTPAKLDALVKDRVATAEAAKKLIGDKLVTDGKTEAEMRRQVVSAKLGDAVVKDWSDDKIAASFATFASLADASKTNADPLALAFADKAPVTDANTAHAAYVKRLNDAWKPAA